MNAPLPHKLIVIEGPPGSGKDVMCDVVNKYIKKHAPWHTTELCIMAARAKKAVHVLFNLFEDPAILSILKDKETGKRLKDMPHRDLPRNMTPRQAYIWLVEKCLRDEFGDDILGQMMLTEIQRSKCDVHIINGIGHIVELEPLMSYVGARNLLVITLPAVGTAQATDGREGIGHAVQHQYPKCTHIAVPAPFALDTNRELLTIMCQGAVKKFLHLTHEDE